MADSDPIKDLSLEKYALELDTDGLTIVPPEVTGVDSALFERCTEVLLERFSEITGGCGITLEDGPVDELHWPTPPNSGLRPKDAPEPTQMLIQQLLQLDRCFRDLFVNPVTDALIGHLFGRNPGGKRSWRYSSTNSFVKWQGD